MTATERFFEMARKRAQGVGVPTDEPDDNAISKKRPSLRVAFWTGIRVVATLAGKNHYLLRAAPSELLRQNSNAVV